MAVRPNGQDDTPEFKSGHRSEKAGALGLSMADINDTMSTAWGSVYVNDFIDRGRVKKVYLQADAPYRMLPEDLYKWYVRNNSGDDGAVLGLCIDALDLRFAASGTLSTACRPWRSSASRRPAKVPATP